MRFPFVSRAAYEALHEAHAAALRLAHERLNQALALEAKYDALVAKLADVALPTRETVTAPVAHATPTPDALLPPAVVAAIAYEANGNPALQRQLQRQALRMAAEQVHPDQMARRILTGDRVTSEDDE